MISTKQKLISCIYFLLGLSPLAYLIAFVCFLYYTGNGFGKNLTYNPQPSKYNTYQTWIRVVLELENFWIASSFLWVLMLIITFLFLRNFRTRSLVIITLILFVIALYLNFFSTYGGHEGWIDNYSEAVKKVYK